MGIFAENQAAYAAHGIATFPLNDNKRPAVRAWKKIGMRASRNLAEKFTAADALGFVTNERNGLAVIDIDTTDERVLADALVRHGETPMIVRTASGKSHVYYRYNFERRRIRPWDGLPIDLLGAGGLVVAPPTHVTKGTYSFLQGSLDDIDRLPIMRGLDASMYVSAHTESPSIVPDDDCPIAEGSRNNTLWRFCMARAATYRSDCDAVIDQSALIDAARQYNADCSPPLPVSEVIGIASSAWGYDTRGSNWFGTGRRVIASHDEIDRLSQDAYYLLTVLRRHHWGRNFVVANAMADSLGWTRKRLADARAELEQTAKIRCLRRGNQWQGPAVYGWP
jgi:hypothetical protein